MYWVEYTVHKPALEEQPRHLLSAVSLGYNGRYNRLITVRCFGCGCVRDGWLTPGCGGCKLLRC